MQKKYFNFINFNIEKMLEYEITNDDAQLLKYLSSIAAVEKVETYQEGGRIYYWLNYSKTAEENPTLFVGETTIQHMVAKLKQKGLIEIVVRCQNGSMLKKSYFRITEKALGLMFSFYQEQEKPKEEVEEKKEEPKESEEPKEDNSEYQDLLQFWNSKGIVKHNSINEKTIKKIKSFNQENFTIGDIKECIDRYVTVLKDENYYFDYKWTLEQFLCQKNTISSFTRKGDKWTNYLLSKKRRLNAIRDKYNVSQNEFNSDWKDKTGGDF